MLVSFVVRLHVDALNAGAIAGEVHNVATGEAALVHSLDDLVTAFTSGADHTRLASQAAAGKKVR